MRVLVNGVQLFFDVQGASLVPDGPTMREKPTLLLLHCGPGFDHSIYKPAYSSLADCAQVIYFDHRGNGRSGAGPKEAWTLAQDPSRRLEFRSKELAMFQVCELNDPEQPCQPDAVSPPKRGTAKETVPRKPGTEGVSCHGRNLHTLSRVGSGRVPVAP